MSLARPHPLQRLKSALLRWAGGLVLLLVLVLLVIAGSDRLFFRAVPLEQRLVSHNEQLRKKAQQELLGTSQDAKHDLVVRLVPALSAQDPFVRQWAAIALALLGSAAQDAVPSLLHGVSDPERQVAQAFRVALSEIGAPDPHQLPSLLEGLRDPHEAVRCEAAAGVAKLGSLAKDALPVFLNEMKSGAPLPECFVPAVSGLVQALPDAVPTVTALLISQDPVVRRNAVEALAPIKPMPAPAAEAFIKVLADDPDGNIRRTVARALRLREAPERGWASTWPAVLRGSRVEAARLAALRALRGATWNEGAKWSAAARGLRDDSPSVRIEAIQWVSEGGPEARPAGADLLPLLRDPDLAIRMAALQALRRIQYRSPPALPAVARAQRDQTPVVRCTAAQVLVEWGAADRVAVPILAADVRKEPPESGCATLALSLAGHQNGDVPYAVNGLLNAKDPEVRRRGVQIATALGARGRELLPALEHAKKDQIPGAALALRLVRDATDRGKGSRRR